MSKSVEGSYINLTDSLEVVKRRLAAVPTDSGRGVIQAQSSKLKAQNQNSNLKTYISNGKESVGVGALMEFVELFQGKNLRLQYQKQYQSTGIQYSKLKSDLAEAIFKQLEPIQNRRQEFEKNPKLVEKILRDGAARAREIASQTIAEVRKRMGLV